MTTLKNTHRSKLICPPALQNILFVKGVDDTQTLWQTVKPNQLFPERRSISLSFYGKSQLVLIKAVTSAASTLIVLTAVTPAAASWTALGHFYGIYWHFKAATSCFFSFFFMKMKFKKSKIKE